MRLLVVATMILGARVAAADPRAEAHQHVERATALHKEGRFADALVELDAAYALDPQPQLQFAMGQLHARLGECREAIAAYDRFLATHPARGPAAMATEAMAACKPAAPAIVEHLPTPTTVIALPPVPAAPVRVTVVHTRPWYTDRVGDALVVAGLATGVAAGFTYHRALGERDAADATSSYAMYAAQIDRAHTDRSYAVALGVAGAALLVIGGLHYALADRHHTEVTLAPGTIALGGRF